MPAKRITITRSCGHVTEVSARYAAQIAKREAAAVAVPCKACHNKQIAPKGWEGRKAKYGAKDPARRQRLYRLEHPSEYERRIAKWLTAMRIEFEREYELEHDGNLFFPDFVLYRNGRKLAIEVMYQAAGYTRHCDDARKANAIQALGYELLTLTSYHMGKAALYRNAIEGFLRGDKTATV